MINYLLGLLVRLLSNIITMVLVCVFDPSIFDRYENERDPIRSLLRFTGDSEEQLRHTIMNRPIIVSTTMRLDEYRSEEIDLIKNFEKKRRVWLAKKIVKDLKWKAVPILGFRFIMVVITVLLKGFRLADYLDRHDVKTAVNIRAHVDRRRMLENILSSRGGTLLFLLG